MDSEPRMVARSVGLRYITERGGGIRRTRRGKSFSYRAPAAIRLDRHRQRIRALAIPPAWTDVWICTDPRGHLQATGHDARGRLQYRYHADWRAACDDLKFQRIPVLGQLLPRIRRGVNRDLARQGVPRRRVLAAIVRLLESSLIRVGNEEYARENGSFGVATLRKRHVGLANPGDVRLRFVGKSGRPHEISLNAPRIARVIRACQDLPGRDLFQFQEADGTVRDITAGDVNAYLTELAGAPVTAKEFRTWGATVLLHAALLRRPRAGVDRDQARHMRSALAEVAQVLGNTVAVCRNSYVHPAVPRIYLAGGMRPVRWRPPVYGRAGLSALERATLRLLRRRSP